jgi:hypothetical protein
MIFGEIRAAENLLKAQILAEFFHNVPAMMVRRFQPRGVYGGRLTGSKSAMVVGE